MCSARRLRNHRPQRAQGHFRGLEPERCQGLYLRSFECTGATNTTPFVAQLNTKYGYFKGQTYRLVFELPGHANAEVKLDSSLSGWYFGNIIFGGLLGMLIVDPLTGAMYNLTPEKIEQPLSATQAQVIREGKGLLVVLASQTTAHEREQMVRVN